MACFHFYREFLKPPLSPLNSPQLCLLPAHCFPECPWPVVCGARPGGVPETGEEPTLPSGSLGAVHTCPDEVGLGPRPPMGLKWGELGTVQSMGESAISWTSSWSGWSSGHRRLPEPLAPCLLCHVCCVLSGLPLEVC